MRPSRVSPQYDEPSGNSYRSGGGGGGAAEEAEEEAAEAAASAPPRATVVARRANEVPAGRKVAPEDASSTSSPVVRMVWCTSTAVMVLQDKCSDEQHCSMDTDAKLLESVPAGF